MDRWTDGIKETNKGEGRRGKKEGRRKGCQYISIPSGPGYTEHFRDLTSDTQQEV